jgi:hypothetical protein
MAGNVAQLASDISEAFNVTHDGSSKRDAIGNAIASAISTYMDSIVVVGTTDTGVCPFTASPHVPLTLDGSLE